MMRFLKNIFIACCILAASCSYGQSDDSLMLVTWNSKPVVTQPAAKYLKESAVILFDARRIQYTDFENMVVEFRTIHKIVHIYDDRGIEAFNKLYLEVADNADIRDIRARTILANGRIIEIDKKNIKDIQEDGRSYKIFALEGVEKGCEIEYYYTYKVSPGFFGKEVLQGYFPVAHAQVEVIAPDRLVFEMKSFNDLSDNTDSLIGNRRILKLVQKDIPGAEDEKYSAYASGLKRIEYKLAYNKNKGEQVRLYTWNELAKLVYAAYSTYSEKEVKKIEELIRREKWNILTNDTDKIVSVENYLKKNLGTRDNISGEDADNIEKILKTKIASNRGMMRVYGAIFSNIGIKYEYVLCGTRDGYELDKKFENWNNADNPMIYFPDLKKYICPTLSEMRFPWINPDWGETNGLFCKPTVIGNFSTAIGVVKPIKLEAYDRTQNNIDIKAHLNETLDTLRVQTAHSFTGYTSVYYRSSYNFSSSEDQKLMLKNMVKFGTESENIISSVIRNPEFDNLRYNNPFIMDASVNAGELVEKAGRRTLIKVGALIGDQAQIYDDKPRQFSIFLHYPHVMKRHIELIIPEGYRITNLNDLNMQSIYKENGERTMGFESTYRVENNTVIIDITEDYRQVSYPLSIYPDFKKIINASADFNKITLALEKK